MIRQRAKRTVSIYHDSGDQAISSTKAFWLQHKLWEPRCYPQSQATGRRWGVRAATSMLSATGVVSLVGRKPIAQWTTPLAPESGPLRIQTLTTDTGESRFSASSTLEATKIMGARWSIASAAVKERFTYGPTVTPPETVNLAQLPLDTVDFLWWFLQPWLRKTMLSNLPC